MSSAIMMEEEKKVDDDVELLATTAAVDAPSVLPVEIRNLTFHYDSSKPPTMTNLDCIIEPNSKVILVGANGAGKSTLLRILTGQIFMGMKSDTFRINGLPKANDQYNGVAYLGGTWKRRRTGFEGVCPYTMDCAASEMMATWQTEFKDRRDELVRILGINLDWRMHECSDGQRKKVRIMIKLLRPFQLCVIDEFAADLDIFSRKRFFDFLSRECESRGAAVVYCTHIFDQADGWATHIAYMQLNKVLSPVHCLATYEPYQSILARSGTERAMCPMYTLVLEELERQYREQSELFTEDNASLDDIIMKQQGTELGDDRFEAEAAGDQTGWVSGRLTRQLNAQEQQVQREERAEKRIALENAAAATVVSTKNPFNVM